MQRIDSQYCVPILESKMYHNTRFALFVSRLSTTREPVEAGLGGLLFCGLRNEIELQIRLWQTSWESCSSWLRSAPTWSSSTTLSPSLWASARAATSWFWSNPSSTEFAERTDGMISPRPTNEDAQARCSRLQKNRDNDYYINFIIETYILYKQLFLA